MVFFNYALRKLNAKIVYYGPGLCGKTTNLQWIHDHFEGGQRGKMLSLATEGDRTIFFDLLPLEIGTIRGMQVTLQLYTVPGQVHYNSTRQLVLRGADGVVFVADSQRTMARSNTESFKNLEENLLLQGVDLKGFPCVVQFNKRDLRDIMSIEEMDQMLNRYSAPFFEAIATSGVGVQETLEGIVKLVMRSLRERYEPMVSAGPRPPEMPVAPGPRPVMPPQQLRVPSAPSAAAAPPRLVPPTPPATSQAYDPRAVTVDLQAATQPPTGGAPAESIAPPPAGGGELDLLVEARAPDDVPTAVFEAPELLEEPIAGGEEGPETGGLDDEVTATGMVAEEAAAFFADEPDGVGELIVEPEPEPPEEPTFPEPLPDVERPLEAPFEGEPSELIFGEAVVTPPEEIEVGEVVLARTGDQEARYEDHVRAPGPFAEIPLRREYPFGEPPSPLPEPARPSEEPGPFHDAVEEPFGPAPELEAEEVLVAPFEVEVPAGAAEEPVAPELEARTAAPAPGPSLEAPRQLPPKRAAAAVDDLVASVIGKRAAPAVMGAPAPPPTAGKRRAPLRVAQAPVLLGEGDPFAMEEEPIAAAPALPAAGEEPVVAAVDVIPRTSAAIQVRAKENQLRVQLQGSGAIAEYGEVREMDILVPVPGPWIGNRRVTLQLRLTLTPAAEDGDVGPDDPA